MRHSSMYVVGAVFGDPGQIPNAGAWNPPVRGFRSRWCTRILQGTPAKVA